jgi:hypothetical protein
MEAVQTSDQIIVDALIHPSPRIHRLYLIVRICAVRNSPGEISQLLASKTGKADPSQADQFGSVKFRAGNDEPRSPTLP